MTISSTEFFTDWVPTNGVQTDFSYDFKILDATDCYVELRVGLDGTRTEYGSGFTLYPTDSSLVGGVLRFPSSGPAMASGFYMRIVRNVPYTQTQRIGAEGAFNPLIHERALDRLTMQTQQLLGELETTLRVRLGETPPDIGDLLEQINIGVDAAAAAEAAALSIGMKTAPDRAAMKALPSSFLTLVNLTEGVVGRENRGGDFLLMQGNFTTQVAADPYEAIYIPANDRPVASACYVRQFTGRKSLTWWGFGPGQTAANNRILFQAAYDAICALYPTWERELVVPEGTSLIGPPPGGNPVGQNPSIFFTGSTDLETQRGQGFSLWGSNFRNCQLQFQDTAAQEACILIEAQEVKFFGIGIIGASPSPYSDGRSLLRFDKGPLRTTDTDCVVRWCRLGTAQWAIDLTGRGGIIENNIFSQVGDGIKLNWRDEGQYLPNWINIPNVNYTIVGGVITAMSLGAAYTTTFSVPPVLTIRSSNGVGSGATVTPIMSGGTSGTITGFTITNGGAGYTANPILSRIDDVQSREGGWRGIIIRSNKFQNVTRSGLNNTGPNRALLNSLIFTHNQFDIGDIAIRGHLGTGFDVAGIDVGVTATEALQICGGFSGTIRGLHVYGMGPGRDRNPDNLVRFEATLDSLTDGIFRNCLFEGWTLLNSQQYGVIAATGTQFVGCTFRDMKGDAIGFDNPAAYSFFRFNGSNSTITFEDMSLIATANRMSFVHNSIASNDIIQRGTKRIGAHTTPFYSGSVGGSSDQRSDWTPATSGLVNLSAPSFPQPLDYRYVADDMVEFLGVITLTVTAVSTNSLVEMTMPFSELFVGASDANGQIVATRNGEVMQGSIQAVPGTNKVVARMKSDALATIATPMGFSLFFQARRRKA